MKFALSSIGALALLVAGSTLSAQMTLTGTGKTSVGVAAYSGPGDIVASAKWWAGLRAYSAAKKGNAAINVCNVADVACADLSTDATTGALVISTIGGSSCSVIACTIKTFYDQTQGTECSGAACDFTQATIGNRPQLIVSCVNGLPCWRCLAASTTAASSPATTSYTQPYTFSTSSVRTAAFTTLMAVIGNTVASVGFSTSSNTGYSFVSSLATAPVADSAFHALQYVFNGAASDINVNGSVNTVNPGTNASGTNPFKLCTNSGGQNLSGDTVEAGLWNVAFSAGNSSSMSVNQRAYWGF